MPATTNKQQLLTQAHALLKKKLRAPGPAAADRPVLEELVYAVCREGVTSEEADRAYESLRKGFLDWNEVRVSTVQEVSDALKPLPGTGARARRIIALLQTVFEEEYAFDLGDLGKSGLKQAAKQLARYKEGVTDFTVSWVIQRTLGGHAVPLDDATLRVLRRLHVLDESEPEPEGGLEALRGTVEHLVPKARGPEFTDLLSVHARTICVADDPHCRECPLKADCPTGIERLAKKTAVAEPKKKPR